MASYSSLWADGVHFTYNPKAYHQHTVVYATLVDDAGPVDMSNLLLGAYIGDVCRWEAACETPPAGSDYFMMRVGGDDEEIGSTITFRVYDQTTQKEYILPDASVTFQGDISINEPSTPKQITFIPGEITLTEKTITVHRGQDVNLDEYVTPFAAGVAVPSYSWVMPIADDAEFISLKGSTLQGLKVTTTTTPATVNVVWGTSVVRLTVNVDAPATAAAFKAEYDKVLTVEIGNTTDITNAIENGWTLTPADATTTFTWVSDNPGVVSFNDTNGEWTANAKGSATITGTANDDSGLGLTLSVNVVQRVTALLLSSNTIYAEVGEDITDRLNDLVTPYPNTASNQGFTWSIVSGDGKVTITSGTVQAAAITELGSPAIVKATANDGFGATAQVNVNVVAQQPTAIAPIQDPLSFTNDPLNPNRDITTEVIANVLVTPAGPLLTDYNPQFTSSVPTVVEVVTTTPTPTLIIKNDGTTTITVTITKKDYKNIDPTTGPADVQLSTSFQVVITNGVASFTFDNVEMTRSGSYLLTLTPKPDGCEYDPEKISISITPDGTYPFPAGWTYVGAAATDKSKLIWDLTAQSVGKGTIQVMYGGNSLGTGTVNVSQQLTLNDGWQWIALHEGSVGDLSTMEKLFGANMDDMRSQDALLINDSQFGYFGALTSLAIQQTYKLKMKDLGAGGMTCTVPGNGYAQLAKGSGYTYNTRVGWNWIGNPYQYYQKLSDALAGNSFTSGDMVKGKNAFATYTGTGWSGSLTHFIPGEGVLLKVQAAGTVVLHSEYDFNQNTTPASARASHKNAEPEPWTIDDSRFDDNMALIARVSGVNDESKVCVWAFVGDECRGRSVFDNGRHFITIHGTPGETVRFLAYDGCTNAFHEVAETIKLSAIGGTFNNPFILHERGIVSAIDRVVGETVPASSVPVYDMEGRRIDHSPLKKGVYIQQGKKIIK